MGCRRKNTLCLSLDFGANDGTLLPRLTRLETSPSPQKRLVLKFPIKCAHVLFFVEWFSKQHKSSSCFLTFLL